MVDSGEFKLGMRRLAAGVSIVTTAEHGIWQGFAATSVSSVSAQPATLLLCINKTISCHDVIVRSRCFCVNILGESDAPIAKRFGSPEWRDRRFELGDWATLQSGAPALTGALVSFDCKLSDAYSMHTHTIAIGEVLAIRLGGDEIDPLIYLNGAYQAIDTNRPPAP